MPEKGHFRFDNPVSSINNKRGENSWCVFAIVRAHRWTNGRFLGPDKARYRARSIKLVTRKLLRSVHRWCRSHGGLVFAHVRARETPENPIINVDTDRPPSDIYLPLRLLFSGRYHYYYVGPENLIISPTTPQLHYVRGRCLLHFTPGFCYRVTGIVVLAYRRSIIRYTTARRWLAKKKNSLAERKNKLSDAVTLNSCCYLFGTSGASFLTLLGRKWRHTGNNVTSGLKISLSDRKSRHTRNNMTFGLKMSLFRPDVTYRK